MGYELHITRRENWYDENSDDITLSEWKEYVENDPDMRLDNYAEAKTLDGDVLLRVESEGLTVWTKYSLDGVDGNHAWFDHGNGTISVKNPDPEIIEKMISIAQHFKARVQGDDGELYGASNSTK